MSDDNTSTYGINKNVLKLYIPCLKACSAFKEGGIPRSTGKTLLPKWGFPTSSLPTVPGKKITHEF